MAFALGAANAPSLGDWLSPGHNIRADQVSYPSLNARNASTSPNNAVNLFIDSEYSDMEYVASIVTACVDQTVYAVRCTDGPAYIGSEICGPNGAIATLTAGESKYEISSAVTQRTLGYDVTVTLQETCVLASTTAATCTAIIKGTVDGISTSKSTVTALSGNSYNRFDVEITGGAEKTANPTACGVLSSAVDLPSTAVGLPSTAAGLPSAAAGLSPKMMAIWAFSVLIGFAGIFAM